MTTTPSSPCLCGTGLDYAQCCAIYHSGQAFAPTAEALMRSRFTAYARRDVPYLLASWDVKKRPAKIDFSKETAQWHSLTIIKVKNGGAKDKKGVVEFKAFYRQDGEECYMHEVSHFIKAGQRWQYVSGVVKSVGKLPPLPASHV